MFTYSILFNKVNLLALMTAHGGMEFEPPHLLVRATFVTRWCMKESYMISLYQINKCVESTAFYVLVKPVLF